MRSPNLRASADRLLLAGAYGVVGLLFVPTVISSNALFVDQAHSRSLTISTAGVQVTADGAIASDVAGAGISRAGYSTVTVTNAGGASLRFALSVDTSASDAEVGRTFRTTATVLRGSESCGADAFSGSDGALVGFGDGSPVALMGSKKAGADPGDHVLAPHESADVCIRTYVPDHVGAGFEGLRVDARLIVDAEQTRSNP